MFNRANKRFKNTLTSGATADDIRAEPGQFDPVLGDGEGVHHICSSTDGIEHETDKRTTTMEPGGDADAHLVVTDRRVLGVLGNDTAEPEFSFDAEAVVRAKGRDGLLSTTLEIATVDETVRFVPDDDTDVERVATTIERVGEAWEDLYDALGGVETAIDEYENRVADGVDPDSALTNVRSRLSRAHHCATKDDFTPDEEMLAAIDPIEDEVDQLRITSRLDRAADLLDDAESTEDSEAAIDAALAADDEIEAARDVHGEVGSTSISKQLTELTVRIDSVCESLLVDARNLCQAANVTDNPGEALSRWEDATERYRTMLDAGWDGQAGASPEAIRYQLAWVVGNRVDALRARADALEAEGDDADDTEKYERAIDCHEQASAIEAECPFGADPGESEAVDRLEDKIARNEWQWGEA